MDKQWLCVQDKEMLGVLDKDPTRLPRSVGYEVIMATRQRERL